MKNLFIILFVFFTLSLFAQNYVLDFDGIDDYITVPGTDSINTAGPYPSRTIEAWFMADTLITDSLQTIYEEGGRLRGFHIFVRTDTLYAGAWNETETSWNGTWYHHKIFANKWYHIALVLDNGTDSLTNNKLFAYLNGYEFSTGNKEGTQIYKHGGDINIGRHGFSQSPEGDINFEGGYFHGRLNEIRVWNIARTQTQIQQNMHQEISSSSSRLVAYWKFDDGSGTTLSDDTVNSNDGTLTNMDPSTDWITGDIPPEPDTPEMMFSEICDNDVGSEGTGFIEIYNPWASSKDLSGYKIIVGTNPTGINFIPDTPEVSFTIPSGTTIDARGVITVSNGANLSDFNSAWGTTLTSAYFVQGNPQLSITSGKAYALDNGSKGIVDTSPEVNANEKIEVETTDLWSDPETSSNGSPGLEESDQDLPLPVILSEFTSAFVNNSAYLYWTTASEENNAYWNIFRAPSNNFGQAVIIAQNIQGQGTTTQTTNYTYKDNYQFYPGDLYYYWIQSVNFAGETFLFGPVELKIPEQNNPEPPEIPQKYGYIRNYPNPFNPSTSIQFYVTPNEKVTIEIYNIKGQKIKEYPPIKSKGANILTWNGHDNYGNKVASGIYFIRLITPRKTFSRKMLLLK